MSTTTNAVLAADTSSCTFQRPCRLMTRALMLSGITTLCMSASLDLWLRGRQWCRAVGDLLQQPIEHVRNSFRAIVVHEVDAAAFGFIPDTKVLGFWQVGISLVGGFDRHQRIVLAVGDHHRAFGVLEDALEGKRLEFLASIDFVLGTDHPFDLAANRRPEVVYVLEQVVAGPPQDRGS